MVSSLSKEGGPSAAAGEHQQEVQVGGGSYMGLTDKMYPERGILARRVSRGYELEWLLVALVHPGYSPPVQVASLPMMPHNTVGGVTTTYSRYPLLLSPTSTPLYTHIYKLLISKYTTT